MSIQIRPVRPGEHEVAGRIVVEAYRALPGSATSGGYEAQLADVATRSAQAEVLVAVADRGVVGCTTFVPSRDNPWAEQLDDGEASVRMLAVDPACQGAGAGAALLGACVERARELGRQAVFLHSTPWMAAAHHLYVRAGFTRVPARDWLPAPEVPLLGFRLELAGPVSAGTGR